MKVCRDGVWRFAEDPGGVSAIAVISFLNYFTIACCEMSLITLKLWFARDLHFLLVVRRIKLASSVRVRDIIA